jgi:nicotinamidase-related amidase
MSGTGERGIALLAIDLQNDFLAGKGRMPVARNQVAGILSAANRLLVLAGEMGWTVAYVVKTIGPIHGSLEEKNETSVIVSEQ